MRRGDDMKVFTSAMGRAILAAALVGAGALPVSADSRPVPRVNPGVPDSLPFFDTVSSTMSASGTQASVPEISLQAPALSVRPVARPNVVVHQMPDLRWDHVRGSSRWTQAAMQALENHGDRLLRTVPRDIAEWCPAYPEADEWDRKAFWAGLLSTLSKHESTYRQAAVGGGGQWYGLVQILPATARGYGCQATSGEALKDGELNMACAVRILNRTVPRDGVVSQGMRGVAADWGPFHSDAKREDMRRWVSAQPFCNGLHRSARPVARPGWIGAPEPESVPLFVEWELDKQFHDVPLVPPYTLAAD